MKKVTDLNFYCLNDIFKHLEIRDLVYLTEAFFPDGLENCKGNESTNTPFEKKAYKKRFRNK